MIEEKTVVTEQEAKQGRRIFGMPTVLVLSTVLAVTVLTVAWIWMM